jgi:hypothetical protein
MPTEKMSMRCHVRDCVRLDAARDRAASEGVINGAGDASALRRQRASAGRWPPI